MATVVRNVLIVIMLIWRHGEAREIDSNETMEIYRLAQSLSHIPAPSYPPAIYLATVEQMSAAICPDRGCPVQGFQSGVNIYIDKDLDLSEPFSATVLLHEFVHFLQYAKYGVARNCAENMLRERQAYAVQNEALARAHIPKRVGLQLGYCRPGVDD